MRLLLVNRGDKLEVQTYFPVGGAFPTGIYVAVGEAVLIDAQPGAVQELAREQMPSDAREDYIERARRLV